MKAYLANSLFSEADQLYNQILAEEIRRAFPDLELYVPQENEAINDKGAYASSQMIADGDDNELIKSELLIAVLDGETIDAGVACEIGKADILAKTVIALYTDVRQQGRINPKKLGALISDPVENQFTYRNLYVIGTIKNTGGKIVNTVEDLIEAIDSFMNQD